MSILNHWSHPTSEPRTNQITALQWLEDQVAKYIILQAPVGSGKSHIGITFSRYLTPNVGKSHILTPQRILQDQYFKEFKQQHLFALYGKSNYSCKKGTEVTCDIGDLFKPRCPDCPYRKAKDTAEHSRNLALNYKLALTHMVHTQLLDRRPLMILDECHQTEDILCEIDAINITKGKARKIGIDFKHHTDLLNAVDWVAADYLPALDLKIMDMEEAVGSIINHGSSNEREAALLQEYNEFVEQQDAIMGLLSESTRDDFTDQYVLVHSESNMKFKRLTAEYSFNKILKPYAERFLFMSSTILNKEQFCKNLGIPLEETAFLSIESEFPPENRPVYYMPQCKMNAKWNTDENENGRKQLLKRTHEILEMHKDDSGIIHTANFAIAEWLVENISTTHKIFHHNPNCGVDRSTAIDAFTYSDVPSVLISPSITEGLDLKDSLSRFAVIAKVPFGQLGDAWIKKRMEMSKDWYQTKALIDIIQGGGRVVRSKDDWGNVYILDASWGYLYKTTQDSIPQWWKDAYCVYD